MLSAADVQEIVDGLLGTAGVVRVELRGSTYSLEACQTIASVVAKCPSIQIGSVRCMHAES